MQGSKEQESSLEGGVKYIRARLGIVKLKNVRRRLGNMRIRFGTMKARLEKVKAMLEKVKARLVT